MLKDLALNICTTNTGCNQSFPINNNAEITDLIRNTYFELFKKYPNNAEINYYTDLIVSQKINNKLQLEKFIKDRQYIDFESDNLFENWFANPNAGIQQSILLDLDLPFSLGINKYSSNTGVWLICIRNPNNPQQLNSDLKQNSILSFEEVLSTYCNNKNEEWNKFLDNLETSLKLTDQQYDQSLSIILEWYKKFKLKKKDIPLFLSQYPNPPKNKCLRFATNTMAMLWTTYDQLQSYFKLEYYQTNSGLFKNSQIPEDWNASYPSLYSGPIFEVNFLLESPITQTLVEMDVNNTNCVYLPTNLSTTYQQLYQEIKEKKMSYYNNPKGYIPDYSEVRDIANLGSNLNFSKKGDNIYDIAVYQSWLNSSQNPTLSSYDGISGYGISQFHQYLSQKNEFYRDKTFKIQPFFIGNFEEDQLISKIEQGFISTDLRYETPVDTTGNEENQLDIHTMFSVAGNLNICYLFSSPYLGVLSSILISYLYSPRNLQFLPKVLSSSYGYSNNYGLSTKTQEILSNNLGLIRKMGINIIYACGDCSNYPWEFRTFNIIPRTSLFGPGCCINNIIEIGGSTVYHPNQKNTKFDLTTRTPMLDWVKNKPSWAYSLFGTAGGFSQSSTEFNESRSIKVQKYLNWFANMALNKQVDTPDYDISNATNARAIPDLTGQGYVIPFAIKNGQVLVKGSEGGTSMAAPYIATILALGIENSKKDEIDLQYYLYKYNLTDKTDKFVGSIGTGFSNGWTSSSDETEWDPVYGLGHLNINKLINTINSN